MVFETKPQISDTGRLSHLAANAPFGAKTLEELSHQVASPHGTGRILPSLIDEEPAERMPRDSTSSRQKPNSTSPRRQGKPRHGQLKGPLPQRNSQPTADAIALAEKNVAKVQTSDDGAPPNQTVTKLSHFQTHANTPKVQIERAPRKASSIDAGHIHSVPSAAGQTIMAESITKATSRSDRQEPATPVRKHRIRGRNIVGDEFKRR